MKAIKKVEVTPIDYNIGKIINSASTTDDKTKNTYSMKVIGEQIDAAVEPKADASDVYTKTEVDNKFTDTTMNYRGKWNNLNFDVWTEENTGTWLTVLYQDKLRYRSFDNLMSSYQIITKGDFAVVSFSFSASGQNTYNYPTGFNKNNCIVISVVLNGMYRFGGTSDNSYVTVWPVNDNILVTNTMGADVNGKFVLMKIS